MTTPPPTPTVRAAAEALLLLLRDCRACLDRNSYASREDEDALCARLDAEIARLDAHTASAASPPSESAAGLHGDDKCCCGAPLHEHRCPNAGWGYAPPFKPASQPPAPAAVEPVAALLRETRDGWLATLAGKPVRNADEILSRVSAAIDPAPAVAHGCGSASNAPPTTPACCRSAHAAGDPCGEHDVEGEEEDEAPRPCPRCARKPDVSAPRDPIALLDTFRVVLQDVTTLGLPSKAAALLWLTCEAEEVIKAARAQPPPAAATPPGAVVAVAERVRDACASVAERWIARDMAAFDGDDWGKGPVVRGCERVVGEIRALDITPLIAAASAMDEEPVAWTPTAANINALPDPLRRYIHDLETRADPAGDVRENHRLREENAALRVRLSEPTVPAGDEAREAGRVLADLQALVSSLTGEPSTAHGLDCTTVLGAWIRAMREVVEDALVWYYGRWDVEASKRLNKSVGALPDYVVQGFVRSGAIAPRGSTEKGGGG